MSPSQASTGTLLPFFLAPLAVSLILGAPLIPFAGARTQMGVVSTPTLSALTRGGGRISASFRDPCVSG